MSKETKNVEVENVEKKEARKKEFERLAMYAAGFVVGAASITLVNRALYGKDLRRDIGDKVVVNNLSDVFKRKNRNNVQYVSVLSRLNDDGSPVYGGKSGKNVVKRGLTNFQDTVKSLGENVENITDVIWIFDDK